MMAALAKTWNDDAECCPLDVITKIVNNAATLGRRTVDPPPPSPIVHHNCR